MTSSMAESAAALLIHMPGRLRKNGKMFMAVRKRVYWTVSKLIPMLKIYQRAVCKSQAVRLSVVQASDSLACQLEHLVRYFNVAM